MKPIIRKEPYFILLTRTAYAMVRDSVESLNKDLSENLEVISDIPNPCMNNPMTPT